MTKLSPLLAAALIFGTAVPAPAAPPSSQHIDGRIQEASGYGSGECRFEAHRIAMLTTSQPSVVNGAIGHSFDVDQATIGGRFVLRPTTEVPRDADLAIAFYESLGEVTDPSARPERLVFDKKRGGLTVERGRVPKGLPVAIVCLFAAETPTLFTYRATSK